MPASPGLLRVELGRRKRTVLDGREEAVAVVGPGELRLRERGLNVERPLLRGVRVHEVEALVANAVEQHRVVGRLDRVPAHVRQHRRVELV